MDRLLRELIDRHRVLLVCATAGAGKTTAVAQATRRLDRRLAWLTVDHTDAAPGRLLTYLEAALARQNDELSGVATGALAAGIPHEEAVGLLVEAAGEQATVIVLDDLERLGDDAPAWVVIDALLRYAPEEMHVILISRRELPGSVSSLQARRPVVALGEADLAFTSAEAAQALSNVGSSQLDSDAVVRATGGWVTGVLFEAWRSEDHVAGSGGETDPLYGYLSTQILDQLDAADQEFLIVSSILDEVTAERAEALGLSAAGERLASLRAAHLPVSWEEGWRAMRCNTRFREYLLDRLDRRGPAVVRDLRLEYADLLAAEGHHEEATEERLRAGALLEAVPSAEQAIFAVIERLDFAIAERWLAALASVCPAGATPLNTAELMLAIAKDEFGRAVGICDRLAALGDREALASASPQAAALMGWSYLHQARLDDVRAVIAAAGPSPEVDVVRYAAWLLVDYADGEVPRLPEFTGGPVDVLVLHSNYFLGRLDAVVEQTASRWSEALGRPYRIAALRALGRTSEALALYESTSAGGPASLLLRAAIGPELLIDAGRLEEASDAVAEGRRLALASGSLGFQAQNAIVAAKLAARLRHDPATTRAALDQLESDGVVRLFQQTSERFDMWCGFALLRGDDEDALSRLRRATYGMVRGERLLELPTAAVYLSEAEWRAGDEDAADRAADCALDAAHRQGSNHLLLQALADFPAVASRRIDAEPGVDGAWHQLGRALVSQDRAIRVTPGRVTARLREFGGAVLLVDGIETRMQLTKSYELLAYLCATRREQLTREELLDALFGRADRSTRSYLRQAIQQLRAALPDGALTSTRDHLVLSAGLPIGADSVQFEAALTEAARLQDEPRLEATLAALGIYDQGVYLPDAKSPWADDRRRTLGDLALEARFEAAELALANNNLADARRLCEDTLINDPYREAAWRLRMRIASALGDEAGMIGAYQRCELALGDLHITPADSTRQLLQQLRR